MPLLTLSFYARRGLFYDPTRPQRTGQKSNYVGREFVEVDGVVSWPAIDKAYKMTVDPSMLPRLRKKVRKEALWPADEATAKLCHVQLTKVEHQPGGWVEKKTFKTKKGDI